MSNQTTDTTETLSPAEYAKYATLFAQKDAAHRTVGGIDTAAFVRDTLAEGGVVLHRPRSADEVYVLRDGQASVTHIVRDGRFFTMY